MSKTEDLTGKQFGRLTVIGFHGRNKNHKALWDCVCSCENHTHVVVLGDNLKRGNTTSCGCKRKETIHKNKKRNKYILNENYGTGFDDKGNSFIFDIEDYNKIKDYTWYKTEGYWYNRYLNKPITHVILSVPSDIIIDHINRNPSDNRKNNLRLSDKVTNGRNSSLKKNNTSGVSGVCKTSDKKKWRAYLQYDGKQINLGIFDLFEDAVKARLYGELKYFKEFAPQKNLFKEYGIE